MKKSILLLLLLATPFLVKASHIVGGEFELLHIEGTSYRLNLILYFDLHNGNPQARDLPGINVRIFRNRDNQVMQNVYLPFIEETSVHYTSILCSIGDLETSKLFYSTIVQLSPGEYSDQQGYYVSWERCCRNYGITNIFSEAPSSAAAIYAGQTFYLEFPAVVKNGEPFIDSTPRLFPPLSDYACVNKPYYVDFSGTDNDGDSLRYSLVTPLNTKSADALPPVPPGETSYPRPKPYPNVTWRSGYSLTSVMKGKPDLAISTEGLLTVTPTKAGLFVFAVRVEEFRNGIKIGETRRDFQMLAVTCLTSTAPTITGKNLSNPNVSYKDNMNITFQPNTPDAERCIYVDVYDPDFHNSYDFFSEQVKIRVKGVKGTDKEVTLPPIKNAILTKYDSIATFKICFDECPPNYNTPYQIQIIAADDACAVPLLDTLRISVTVKTPPNTPAKFIKPDPDIIESLKEGDPLKTWPIRIVDADGDSLNVSYFTDGFNFPNVGMELDYSQNTEGIVIGSLSWEPACNKYDFSEKQNFNITMVADDLDFCSYNKADTARFNLTLILPPNADPVIDVDITPVYSERFVDGGMVRIFDKVDFNVFGHDDDVGFPISLEAHGVGYQLTDYGMQFPGATGSNNISSHFSWPLECNLFDLAERDSFNIEFIVIDKSNKCKIYQADTVDVAFKVLPPFNATPTISLRNMHPETTTDVNTASSFWGHEIEFLVQGSDTDVIPTPDIINISLIEVTGNVEPSGYTFTPASGQKDISARFTWTPDCSIFKNDLYTNTYEFKFRIWDNHCLSTAADTVTLTLNVSDYLSTDENFQPVSVITPNEDKYNSYFALDGIELRDDGTNPNSDINLPLDNCINKFEYINIYNRWGKLVFTSNSRFFRWYAPNAGAGVYYYFLKFTQRDYKGSLLVRF